MKEKLLAVIQAVTGFAGSSESPEKVSLRLIGLFTAGMSKFIPVVSLFVAYTMKGVTPEQVQATADGITAVAQPIVLFGACLIWITGAFKAGYKAWIQPTMGRIMGR